VGLDDASLSYIKKKIDLAASIGINFKLHQFMEDRINAEKYHETFKKISKSTSS
jgi:5,10-methylene-tetrahydrofolate dehydrogenase/methenyl tetrahydrofolate cyclohydrolase